MIHRAISSLILSDSSITPILVLKRHNALDNRGPILYSHEITWVIAPAIQMITQEMPSCDYTMDELDKKIITLIQGDIPLELRPFETLAQDIGITEDEVIDRIKTLKRDGIIRRFGATLRHQEAGFSSNAMVAWIVPDDRIDEIGWIMAGFHEVTHCYHRRPQEGWRYNLYTMIHGESKEACYEVTRRLSRKTGCHDYAVLFSEKEFKKTSMVYFKETASPLPD